MPANEGTVSVSPPQIGDNFLRKVCDNSLQSNLARLSSGDDEEDYQDGCLNSIAKGESREDCNYRSLPVKEVHEKFMRSFIDLLLEEAVFEVNSLLKSIVRGICMYIDSWLLK